jgi:hypothetical protein
MTNRSIDCLKARLLADESIMTIGVSEAYVSAAHADGAGGWEASLRRKSSSSSEIAKLSFQMLLSDNRRGELQGKVGSAR